MEDQKHEKDTIGIIASLIAAVLMAFMTIITFRILENFVDAKYLFAISPFYFVFVPWLQNRIANFWKSKQDTPTRNVIIPNKSMKQVILNATLVSIGIYLGFPIIIEHIITNTIDLTIETLVVIILPLMIFAISIPIIMYFIGEWIGRSLGNKSKAIIVSLMIVIIQTLLIWSQILFVWSKQKLSMETEHVDGILIFLGQNLFQPVFGIYLIVFFLINFIPLTIGACRGAHYKNYFDLAFYANRLDDETKSEIDDFIVDAGREYLNLQGNEPNKK